MKNILAKINIIIIALFIFIGTSFFVNAQNMPIVATGSQAISQNEEMSMGCGENGCNMMGEKMKKGWGMMDNHYYNNFYDKDFDFMHNVGPFMMGGMMAISVIFFVIGLVFLAFWIWMLVHAIKHDIDYKPVWILVLWFLNIIGAIIYYFAVKRQCPCCTDWENVCICENGKCVCGEMSEEKVEEIKEEMK